MSNNVLIGVVVAVIVVLVGFFLVYNKSSYSPPVQPQSTTQGSQKTISPTTQQPSPANEATKEQNIITLTQDGFSPSTLTIKTGTKATWINKSGSQAAVNSNPHPVHTNYSPFNLGSFSDGSTLSLIFDKTGTYGYHNHLNPSQSGTIIVQ